MRPKLILLTLGAVLAAAGLLALVATLYLTYDAKPRVESFASDALGVEVRIGGVVHIGLLPSLHVGAADVHMLDRGAEFASAGRLDLGIGVLPAFQHQVRISRIALKRLKVSLERDRNGQLNLRGSDQPTGSLPDVAIANVTASNAALFYKDDRTGNGFEAQDCSMRLGHVRLLAGGPRAQWVKSLSFGGEIACARFHLMDINASSARLAVEGSNGVLDFNPVTFALFDGQASGNVRADFSRPQPLYEVRYGLAAFHIDEAFRTLSAKPVGSGSMNFSANLTMRGTTLDDLVRTAAGDASLHGEHLTLATGDLDKKFERFESSQNFNLVDVGAFFFAGPIGLGITKGYDYARMLQRSEGTTVVSTLVSEWRVEHGVANATDVAMATARNRVALRGGLDFVRGQFQDITIALIDPDGCPEAEQKVRGPFARPEVGEPSVLKTLAGPTRHLFGKATSLLGHKCVSFYSGAVEPPDSKPPK